MKKLAIFVLTLTLVLALVGCGKTEPEYLRVYSFNGENERFTVSNGVIVLDDTKEIFYGGELKATDDFLSILYPVRKHFISRRVMSRKLSSPTVL